MDDNKKFELNDEELDKVAGGYSVGDTVRMKSSQIRYCPGCGKLLLEYEATITGVRGVHDGKTYYYITHNCCGYKSSEIESAIID